MHKWVSRSVRVKPEEYGKRLHHIPETEEAVGTRISRKSYVDIFSMQHMCTAAGASSMGITVLAIDTMISVFAANI